MRAKKILLLALVFGAGICLGVYIRNQTLNPKATIPSIIQRPLAYLVKEGEKEDEDILYNDVNISDFIVNGSPKTKVAVVGVVADIPHEPDGDYHLILKDPFGSYLVTETIPQIKLPLPQIGQKVRVWGITRFDVLHNWWEIHPVIGWEPVK